MAAALLIALNRITRRQRWRAAAAAASYVCSTPSGARARERSSSSHDERQAPMMSVSRRRALLDDHSPIWLKNSRDSRAPQTIDEFWACDLRFAMRSARHKKFCFCKRLFFDAFRARRSAAVADRAPRRRSRFLSIVTFARARATSSRAPANANPRTHAILLCCKRVGFRKAAVSNCRVNGEKVYTRASAN